MTEAFKVTRRDPKAQRSYAAKGLACLEYEPGAPTRAECGGCLVFDTAAHALNFIDRENMLTLVSRRDPDICLWRCQADEPLTLGFLLYAEQTADVGRLYWAWADARVEGTIWPPGTLAFKEVTLTEQLLGPGMEL